MVLVDLSLLDGLWLLCNQPQQLPLPCQPVESQDWLFTGDFKSVVVFFGFFLFSLCDILPRGLL